MLKTAIASLCAVAALSLAAAGGNSKQDTNLAKGVFGEALNVFGAPAHSARSLPAYKTFPLTVEFWCKLNSYEGFNILVANETKDSASHWELYSEPNTGTLSAYLKPPLPSGYEPRRRLQRTVPYDAVL